MLSGAYGAWLFRTPYTTALQKGVVAFIPYLLLGKLASGSGMHEQLLALFHIFRIFGGILAIFATYDFLALFLVSIHLRRLGLALCVCAGGLGWIAVLLGSKTLPLEFYSPETFGFLSILRHTSSGAGTRHIFMGSGDLPAVCQQSRSSLVEAIAMAGAFMAGDGNSPTDHCPGPGNSHRIALFCHRTLAGRLQAEAIQSV